MDNVNFVVVPMIDEEKAFSCTEECKDCKGGCCKATGCCFSPDDFYVFRNKFSEEDRLRYLIAFLKRGYASIDHVMLYNRDCGAFETSDKNAFMNLAIFNKVTLSKEKILKGDGALLLRMRNEGAEIVDVCHTIFREQLPCVGLTEYGCKFSFKKRPKGGRLLRPRRTIMDECIPLYTEIQAALDWFPHREVLYKAYEYFKK